jgi:cytochrome P450
LITNLFYGIAPDFHAVQNTNDRWRYQRKLLQDLMTPTFLNEVAAPQLHQSFMDLIELWSVKMRLSEGHPFSVKHDIFDTALEAIWAAVFGNDDTATVTKNQIELLSGQNRISLPPSMDDAVEFPRAPAPPNFLAVLELTDSIETVTKSPLPKTTGFIQRYLPHGRKHLATKKQFTNEEITKAEKRMKESEGKETKITNAVDHLLRREKMAAEKAQRPPQYHSNVMIDEVSLPHRTIPHNHTNNPQIFGLLIAGHDTTSTTLSWGLKYLTSYPSIQSKLREELHSTFASAHAEHRVPSAHEIATTPCHYLDAFIEEIVRCGGTAGVVSRTTTQDVVVLGKVIPKGTMVLLMGLGGGVMERAHDIPDNLRSEQYRKAGGGKNGTWDSDTIKEFDPTRWLVRDGESGGLVFDSQAGPHFAFGGGLRGCFGRKLAYLELRLVLVLVMWHFRLEEVSGEQASWEPILQLTHGPVHCYVRLAKA